MREILFRGKPVERFKDFLWVRKDLFNELGFVYGSLFVDKSGRTYICVDARCTHTTCINNGEGTMIEVIPETVGQYTERKDMNGRMIVEGDVVTNEKGHKGRITWYTEHCAFMIYSITENKVYWLYDSNLSELEVIGNIHSNPELLE